MRALDRIRDWGMGAGTDERSPRSRPFLYSWQLLWLVWMPFFIPPLVTLLQSHPDPVRLIGSLTGSVVFITVYLWTTRQSARSLASPVHVRQPALLVLWLPLVILIGLSGVLVLANGTAWGGLFFFTSAAVAGRLPWWQAAVGLVALGLLLMLVGRSLHAALSDGISAVLMIFIIGFAVITVMQSVTANRKLRAEREEMARFAAVMEERLRIARDLHDLLGHNLSLIALKSELARRLIDAAPQRAASEIGEIEGVARTALQEVREAVAAYRQPTLAGELRGAQEILALAGIAYERQGDDHVTRMLPSMVEGVLAWTVREGVTNVIRHSHARHCRISVVRADGCAQVEVMDDGRGFLPEDATSADTHFVEAESMGNKESLARHSGNGLRGLAERVKAVDGRFEAGPRADGGFRLAVSVPFARQVEGESLLRQTAMLQAPEEAS